MDLIILIYGSSPHSIPLTFNLNLNETSCLLPSWSVVCVSYYYDSWG